MADAPTRIGFTHTRTALFDNDGAKIPSEPPLAWRLCDSPLRNKRANRFFRRPMRTCVSSDTRRCCVVEIIRIFLVNASFLDAFLKGGGCGLLRVGRSSDVGATREQGFVRERISGQSCDDSLGITAEARDWGGGFLTPAFVVAALVGWGGGAFAELPFEREGKHAHARASGKMGTGFSIAMTTKH